MPVNGHTQKLESGDISALGGGIGMEHILLCALCISSSSTPYSVLRKVFSRCNFILFPLFLEISPIGNCGVGWEESDVSFAED